MTEGHISVADFAAMYGLQRPHVFKLIKRLGTEPVKKRSNHGHGQFVSYLSKEDTLVILASISKHAKPETQREDVPEISLYDIGVFYLIQLEPEHDPNRFKVGFASDIDVRLRAHRCSAPFAQVLKSWPCRRLWEKTAIECVTIDCERLHTEVFRTSSLEFVISKCTQFFDLMPQLLETTNNDLSQT